MNDKREYRKLRGIITYLIIFSVVVGTTILRFYDKISPDITGLIFGVILGIMIGTLSETQKEWFNDKEE